MEADQYHRQVQRLTDEMSQHRRDAQQSLHQVGCLTTEISQLRQEAISAAEHRRELEVALARMHASRSWRLTQPCRATGLRLTRLYRRFLGHRARRDF
jgi:DNA anti-recombination protein RmuC